MQTKTKSPVAESKLGKEKQRSNYDTSLSAQRTRILRWLTEAKSLTTLQARSELDVLHPAGRVRELRKLGWKIMTNWTIAHTPLGKHRIAKYFLSAGKTED